MKYESLKDFSTLITSTPLRQVQKELLKTSFKGIRITSLFSYVLSLDPKEVNWTIRYEIYERFKSIQNEINIFRKNLLNSSFIEECVRFLEQMQAFDIASSELPEETPAQIELKKMISFIEDIPTQYAYLRENVETLDQDLSSLYLDIPYPDLFESFLIEKLVARGAHLLQNDTSSPNIEYYHAINARLEVEGIAQKIINMNLEDVLVAYSDASYLPLIKRVFDRYQIPLLTSATFPHSISYHVIALLKFAKNPDVKELNECLNQKCFGDCSDFLQAQALYPYPFDQTYPEFEESDLKGICFTSSEIQRIKNIIEKGNYQKKQCMPYLKQLTSADSIKDLFLCIDSIIRTFHNSEKDKKSIQQIQNLLKEALPYVHDLSDLDLLIDQLKKMRLTSSSFNLKGVLVTSLKDMTHPLPYTFVVGTSQSQLNPFTPLSGIFDETYVSMIPSFPPLDSRYKNAHQHLISKLSHGQHLILSYPQSDYQGKNLETSLIVDQLISQTSQPFDIRFSKEKTEIIQNLNHPKTVYLQNNELKGSVSSLEKFVGCPYAYFLKYGCHLKEPLEEGFNIQKIGTLNHAILENLALKYGKDYVYQAKEEIKKILDINFEDMKRVFPHLNLQLIQNRMMESMERNLEILKDMEKHSYMQPTYCEYKWEKELPLDSETLHLVGYVDRVDTSPTAFCVLDYKSSFKKLEKDKFLSGQQLQLCTYLTVLNEQLSLRPLGGFYYSLQNPKIELPYQKLSRRSKEISCIDETAIQNEKQRIKRLQGWIFDENVEIMDDDGTHVVGISNTKSKGITARQVLNMGEISQCVYEMMRLIAQQILSGHIQCEPNEAACLFCKYSPICRFNGSFTEKKPLVETPSCMRKEGESHE